MKNKNGFTLMEVLLALFILMGAVSIFSSLHFKSLARMWRDRERLDRIFLAQKDLYDIFFKLPKKEKPVINNIEEPDVKITTQAFDIHRKSELKDFMDFIKIIKVDTDWISGPDVRSMKMISFVLRSEEKE
jgi:hypothetical protein